MNTLHRKSAWFGVEFTNSCAATYYFYYVFFFTSSKFGFTDGQNLLLAAVNGFAYIFASLNGGRFASKHGYTKALRLGFTILIASMIAGLWVNSIPALIFVHVFWTIGICYTWPTLEALVTEGETRQNLPKMVGLYNLVWAVGSAFAYFIGGAVWEACGPRSLFWIPAIIHGAQLLFVLKYRPPEHLPQTAQSGSQPFDPHPEFNPRPIAKARTFLRMAWIGNPLAYMAINAIVPVIPGLAKRFNLSASVAGVICSTWFFARFASFLILWLWNGWHYRFRWFVAAYIGMILGFISMLTVQSLAVLIIGQIIFGLSVGLFYHSSLFYSMDAGHSKGEQGGIHEAAIGSGIFAGPAVGALSTYLLPHSNHSSAIGVSLCLILGLLVILRIQSKGVGPHY